MAHGGRAVPNLYVADRVLARLHAVKKVSEVIDAVVQPDGVLEQRGFKQFRIAGLDLVAVDPDPAGGAFKSNAVALATRLDVLAVRIVVTRGVEHELNPVFVSVGDAIVAVCREPAWHG